jgi:hypothetical protein
MSPITQSWTELSQPEKKVKMEMQAEFALIMKHMRCEG